MISKWIEKRFSRKYPQPWVHAALLCAFCFFLFFLNLGRWDLWNPDEPRYAQVAREMVQGGDWILMHFNGETYGDKPPLFFWLIGLSSRLWGGFNPFAVRFPSALFGTLAVLLTYLLGKRLYSPRAGLLSGLVLASSFEFAFLSTRANIDATLAFFTTAAFYCFFLWLRQADDPRPEKRRAGERWIYGFYAAMALGTLTKGPVGLILPLLSGLAYLGLQRDWQGIRRMKLLRGSLLMLAIVLSWYLPAVVRGGEAYLNETLLRQTVERYATGWSHVRPFYYYLYNFPLDFLPWTIFVPAAIAYGCSRERSGRRKDFLFLVTWCAVIFLFFSLSKGKRGVYLLPLFPAASLLVGGLWDDVISASTEPFRMEWIAFPLYGWMGLTLAAGAAIPWFTSASFPSYLPYSLPLAFLMVGGALAMFVLHRFKKYCAIFFLLLGVASAGFFYTLRVVFPLVNPYKSARFICQEVTSRIHPEERLGLYGGIGSGPYNFYTGIVPIVEMERREALVRFLRSPERVFCLLRFKDFLELQSSGDRTAIQLIARRRVGGDDIALISNR